MTMYLFAESVAQDQPVHIHVQSDLALRSVVLPCISVKEPHPMSFNHVPNNLNFEKILWKTLWVKEKMLVTRIFSFSHNVFYPIKEINFHYSNIEIVACKCFQFEPA